MVIPCGIPPNHPKMFTAPAWKNSHPATTRSSAYAISSALLQFIAPPVDPLRAMLLRFGDLRAQLCLALAQLGRERVAEIRRVEHLPDLDLRVADVRVRAPLH